MALLNFKHGLLEKLAEQTFQPGTVYITSDERAMYIDLPVTGGTVENDRIRIGDFIQYNSLSDLITSLGGGTDEQGNSIPIKINNISQTAFYYCVQENALLKWNGTNWVRVNLTQDVADILETINGSNGLVTKVESLETNVNNINNVLGVDDNSGLRQVVAQNTQNIKSNTGAINVLNGDNTQVGSVAKAVADAKIEILGTDHNGTVKQAFGIANAAQTLAQSAQDTADANSNSIDAINNETTGILAEAKKYTNEVKDTIMGTENEAGSTVYGALKAAADAQNTANGAQGDVDGLGTLVGTIDNRLKTVELFFVNADTDTDLIKALDTLKEIQDYLDGEGAIADDILTTLTRLEAAVGATTDTQKVDGSIYARINHIMDQISALQGKDQAIDQTLLDHEDRLVTVENAIAWGSF